MSSSWEYARIDPPALSSSTSSGRWLGMGGCERSFRKSHIPRTIRHICRCKACPSRPMGWCSTVSPFGCLPFRFYLKLTHSYLLSLLIGCFLSGRYSLTLCLCEKYFSYAKSSKHEASVQKVSIFTIQESIVSSFCTS